MDIKREVQRLVEEHHSRDPLKIAKAEGITLEYDNYEDTKGYFLKIRNRRVIIINENLDDLMQLFVTAHELGHAILHHDKHDVLKYEKGIYFMKDDDLFRTNSIYERQANIFAYELVKHALEDIVLPEELHRYINKYRYFFKEIIQ